MRQYDEALRIVPDTLWTTAQSARECRDERHVRDGRGRIRRSAPGCSMHRKRLLAGFLRCGEWGGSFHAINGCEWGCSWHKDRGTCGNAVLIPEGVLERAALAAVRDALDEELAKEAIRVALDELRDRIAKADRTTSSRPGCSTCARPSWPTWGSAG